MNTLEEIKDRLQGEYWEDIMGTGTPKDSISLEGLARILYELQLRSEFSPGGSVAEEYQAVEAALKAEPAGERRLREDVRLTKNGRYYQVGKGFVSESEAYL